jgi:hypothetical protein
MKSKKVIISNLMTSFQTPSTYLHRRRRRLYLLSSLSHSLCAIHSFFFIDVSFPLSLTSFKLLRKFSIIEK